MCIFTRAWVSLAIFFSSSVVISGEIVPLYDPALGKGGQEMSFALKDNAIHYLSELSNRRRMTTVFINEQSPLYGVQMNFVNVGRGNLTFLNRDLVRMDRVPIVFGRVYDSSKKDVSDFGPGWKLSVAEVILQSGKKLLYRDASNSFMN